MIPGAGNGEKPFFSKIFYYLLDNSKKGICQFFLPFAGEKIFWVRPGRGLSFSAFLRTLLFPPLPGVFPQASWKAIPGAEISRGEMKTRADLFQEREISLALLYRMT
jgi:hypothetical protein